jgi:hypothetical protein
MLLQVISCTEYLSLQSIEETLVCIRGTDMTRHPFSSHEDTSYIYLITANEFLQLPVSQARACWTRGHTIFPCNLRVLSLW